MGFVFVPMLAATAIVAGAVWCYVSHVFVVITEETAAGNDAVFMDDDPVYDWLWQGIYIGWFVAVWVVPAFLLGRIVTMSIDDDWRWYAVALIAFLVFWMAFPLSVLSSMAAESRMALFHVELFQRLGKRIGDVAVFYLLSGLLVALCVPLVPWLLTGGGFLPYFVAPPILATVFVLYGRLLGRLACLARLTPIRSRRKKKKQKPKRGVEVNDPWDVPEEVRREDEARGGGFIQPRDLPPIDTPDEGEVTGYDVRFADVPGEEPKNTTSPEEAVSVTRSDDAAEEVARKARQDVSAIEPDKLEMERGRRKREKAPEQPWTDQAIWLFPLQPKISVQWGLVMLGFGFMGVLIQALQVLWPF
jgi:hypothetical protein